MRIACRKMLMTLGLAALITAGTAAGGAGTASAAGEIELFTAYTDLSAPPGESITYSIEVINHSSVTQTAPIALQTNGNNWDYDLTAGGRAIRQISVKPGDSATVNLQLNVPLEVNKGEYRFTVAAGDLDTLPLVVNVSEQGTFASEWTSDQPNMEGHADSSFTFSTELRNRTAEEQTYALAAGVEPGWEVRFSVGGSSVTSVTVDPNSMKTVSVQVRPPESIEAGTYRIPLIASNSATSAETNLEVVVTGRYDIALSTPDDRLNAKVTAGSSRNMTLVVKNTGSAPLENINMSAASPVDWEVTFEPSEIRTLKPGESVNVNASIKSSDKALAGDYLVTMNARTSQKSAEADIRVAVESSVLWGWIGVLIIIAVAGGIYYLFRKYGRR